MKEFHSITTTVFSKDDETFEEIKDSLTKFYPFNLDKEKIKIDIKKAIGFEDKPIKILTIKIEKQNLIKQFAEKLLKMLTQGQKDQLIDELNTRVDEKGNFYLRFDKKTWFEEEKLFITELGNCYHIKFKIAAYPCDKEKAITLMKRFLQKDF